MGNFIPVGFIFLNKRINRIDILILKRKHSKSGINPPLSSHRVGRFTSQKFLSEIFNHKVK